jgi:ATP-dependent helicase HrpB
VSLVLPLPNDVHLYRGRHTTRIEFAKLDKKHPNKFQFLLYIQGLTKALKRGIPISLIKSSFGQSPRISALNFMVETKTSLPIDSLLPECARLLSQQSNLILQASPGSGKTTRVPPYLLNSIHSDGQIWVLQPRRLAAKFAAARVADELKDSLGGKVGYHFRFEKKESGNTRLLYLTEGMLMRRLVSNPKLKGVSVVVLDEFHERHLHTDLSLSFLRHLQMAQRPDLKIVIMSATLELDQLQSYLPNTPVLKVDSPIYPVEIFYGQAETRKKSLSSQVANTVKKHFELTPNGDCLVFLPGMREIRDCENELRALSGRFNFLTYCLHGELSKEEQEEALRVQTRRKVVLSTNIAETSLTIPGVNGVIDSGLQRLASYSWWTGVPLLATKTISKASAIQRAGRAGRTGPGFCYRLYSQQDYESSPAFETPEIRRSELSQTVLELKALGVSSLSHFPWFELPSPSALESAQKLLFQLGAIDSPNSEGKVTPLGIEMAKFSLAPRLSRFLLECANSGCLNSGLHLAALISEGKLQSLEALDDLVRPLDPQSERLRNQLAKSFEPSNKNEKIVQDSDSVARALLKAFPDRIAKIKFSKQKTALNPSQSHLEFVLASGGTASLRPGAQYVWDEKEPYVIAIDVQEFKRQNHSVVTLQSLIPIQESWLLDLSPSPLEEIERLDWNSERQRVFSQSQIILGQLVVDSQEREPREEEAVFKILVRELLKTTPEQLEILSTSDWVHLFKHIFPNQELESLVTRLTLFRKLLSKEMEISAADLTRFLRGWFHGKRSRAEALSDELLTALTAYFCAGREHQLERALPLSLTLPSQRKSKILYSPDKNPWIESRIQDFFGLLEAPKLCDGQLTLTLHLLAPNYRAVQVTTDLKNFWDIHYPILRKELSRHYPKHAWPENPRIPLPINPKKKV